jgi:transcriptional regulator with XRE-family HTH domain
MKPVQPKTTPERLRVWRRSRDLTQESFALLCKLAKGSGPIISMIEKGRRLPSFALALKIERATRGTDQIRVEAWGYDRATAELAP